MKITSGVYAQGSFGLVRINRENGVRIGNVIRVWHVVDDNGKIVKSSLTRREARNELHARQAQRSESEAAALERSMLTS